MKMKRREWIKRYVKSFNLISYIEVSWRLWEVKKNGDDNAIVHAHSFDPVGGYIAGKGMEKAVAQSPSQKPLLPRSLSAQTYPRSTFSGTDESPLARSLFREWK